jgi:hypothetical protein
MRRDPAQNFAQLFTTLFGIEADPIALNEALAFYSFANQKQRENAFSADPAHHFHFNGATDYTDRIAPATLEMIVNRLNRELTHTFGYDYTL